MKHSYDKIGYKQYLKSPHWRRVRKRALMAASYRCEGCGTSETILQTHHNNYENLGCELLADLNVYCSECHTLEHSAKAVVNVL